MVVLSNHRLGPGAELLVSREVAGELLREVAAAARPAAEARWEHELVTWLERCATAARISIDGRGTPTGSAAGWRRGSIDVTDIAWTPEHFERQRSFLIEAIRRAEASSPHARALARWCHMIEAHPRESVQVGRRWQWPSSEATI